MRLTPGVSFSDGARSTRSRSGVAERLLSGYNVTRLPPARGVTGVEVQDALTVVIVTAEPYAPLMAHLAHPATAIVPGGHGRDLDRAPVGSGAYELAEWLPNERIVLRANVDHRNGAPAVPEVEFRTEPNEDALIAGLRNGELHLAPGARASGARADRRNGNRSGSAELERGAAGCERRSPQAGLPQRAQALALAVDKSLPGGGSAGGLAEPRSPPCRPRSGSAPRWLDEPYPYEPEAARGLLATEGLTELTLTHWTRRPGAGGVAQRWRTCWLASV